MLNTYYLYLNFRKSPKKSNNLEINKKKSRQAWKNKSRKGDIDTKVVRHEAQGAPKAREYVKYESR